MKLYSLLKQVFGLSFHNSKKFKLIRHLLLLEIGKLKKKFDQVCILNCRFDESDNPRRILSISNRNKIVFRKTENKLIYSV